MFFRADGNEEIATGHIMRCLSIAEALRGMGEESTFILADERPRGLIEDKGFSVLVLNSAWNDLEQELSALIEYIHREQIKALFIDSYYVTKQYMQQLREHTKLIYLDDLHSFVYPADVLINYGFLSERISYAEEYEKNGYKDTKFLTGSSYVPLRREFQNCEFRVKEQVENVLITTGGTDSYNAAGKVLRHLAGKPEFENIAFHVIIGCFNVNRASLVKMASENSNIFVYENTPNMMKIMQKCDAAVTAGGTTTFELCAVGVPSICFSIAQNQQEGARNWDREGIMLYAGDMQAEGDACIKKIVDNLSNYVKSYELRKEKSAAMRRLVDGCGAKRIAQELINIAG